MTVHVKRQGPYRLRKTQHGHRILELEGREQYAWVQGQIGEILIRSDEDHQFESTLQQGQYKLVDFENDPEYKDMPHLFLENDGAYDELMLPNGFPTGSDYQKKVVKTDHRPRKNELEDYLQHPARPGPGENRLERKASETSEEPDLPIPDYRAKTVEEIDDRVKDLSKDELEQVKRWEQDHKDRKTVLETVNSAIEQKRKSS